MMDKHQKVQFREVERSFAGYLFGFFLTFSAYSSMFNLQSSINVEDGLGTITIAFTYFFSNIFIIFATPILIRTLGVKKCFVVSELGYLIFILANLYPEFYTLIPAGLFAGIAEANLWPCVSLLNVHFAILRSEICEDSSKGTGYYTNLYSGYFFMVFQFCQIFGNLLSSSVLYGSQDPQYNGPISNPNTTEMSSTPLYSTDKYQYCGSQDCQDPNLVADSIDQYVPTSEKSIKILICIMTVMIIGSQFIHWCMLPNDIKSITQTDVESTTVEDVEYVNSCYCEESIPESSRPIKTMSSGPNHETKLPQLPEDSGESDDKSRKKLWTAYRRTLKDLLSQMKDTKQLLLIPICMYLGSTQAFIFCELTRAYSSCVVGVETIGIHMATYGLADAILSFVVAKLGHKIGRIPFFTVSAVLDFGCYMYCLFWVPSPESAWSIFLVYFSFGFSDGIWQTILNVVHLQYFPSKQDVAVTMWSFWLTMTFALQFAWSSSLCVYVKLYVQLGLLALGMGCFVLAERADRKEKSENANIEETKL